MKRLLEGTRSKVWKTMQVQQERLMCKEIGAEIAEKC
jgi:hypothetical protein